MSFDLTDLHTLIVRAHDRHNVPIGKMMRVALQAAANRKFPLYKKSDGSLFKLKREDRKWLLRHAAIAERQNQVRWWDKAPWSALKGVWSSEPKYWQWFDSAKMVAGARTDLKIDVKLAEAIMHLMKAHQPGRNMPWDVFCDTVRDNCDGWTDRKNRKPKRGFGDKTIKRFVKSLRNGKLKDKRDI
jgi:hypothetical protein